ncbi:MAG TPA: hypothetical protein VGH28_20970 [Polyangiaceae bacterium]
MSVTEDEVPQPKAERAPDPSSRSPESYERLASPSLRAAWLLRTSAIVGVVSSALGATIVPGLRGIASDATITRWEHLTAGVSYAMAFLLAGLLLTGAFDLSRTRKVGLVPRALLFFGAPGVLAMLVPAFAHSLTPAGSLILVVATLLVVIGGASAGLRTPHTRALALVQLVLGFAALARVISWFIATAFQDNLRAWVIARTFATAGVIAEGVAQMVAVAWLSTRRRMASSLASAAALIVAFAIVWMAGRADASSPGWECVLRSGIMGQTGAQSTLGALEAFFVTASVLLAFACALVPRQLTVVTCGIALALLGRGAFDVPLRALAATVAAIWTTLAAADDRAMWKALSATREEK